MADKTDYSKLSPEELIKLLESKDADIATSEWLIGDLKTELTKKEEELLTAGPVQTVKVGNESYEIVIPAFKLYDVSSKEIVDYTALDVVKNDKLAASLVKSGSGVLQKIEKK